MPTAAEIINEIIANAIETANTQTAAASSAAHNLIAQQAGNYFTPPSSEAGFMVEAVEPEIPTAGDSTYTYEAQLDKLIALLSGQLADFFNRYYPLASDAFDEATAWLVNTITNGGTGINPAIEEQVWQRARERVIADGRRVENQILTGYAARGYFMPAGAMLKKIEESRYEQVGKTGEAATAIASKQLEIEIETIKFSIGEAMKSRSSAMQAAADYIRAVASAPDAAARAAALNTDVQAKMMAAAASWYGARLDRDKIVLSSKLAEMGSRDDIYKHQRETATRNSSVDAQALAAAADVYARTASAALASLNSIVSSSVNASE